MFSRKKQSDVVADQFNSSAHGAVDSAASFLDDAIDRITPLVSAAAGRATGLASQIAPLADQARDAASQNLTQNLSAAGDRLAPLASQARDAAKDRLAPATGVTMLAAGVARDKAMDKGADLAGQARDALAPHVQNLRDAAQPHVDTAKTRVQEELVPQLTELLQNYAKDHPQVADYSNRGQVALQALRGETTKYVPVEVDDPSSSKLKTAAKVAAVGAVLAAATVAIRQFLGSKDDGWTAHKPSAAYTPTDTAAAKATTTTPASSGNDVDNAAPLVATTAKDAEEVMVDEGGPVDEGAATTTDETTTTGTAPASDADHTDAPVDAELANGEPQYGEGWYMGDTPPAEYLIKGNERSMKYHVPGSGGYDRTIADVWFVDEDAAQKAGFTRAQR